mmetsp:Transcript_5683/g.20670  ORF Transcript_5683/g.20670 Transcript_5683/m.20670 type:complete len:172 (+) Transcript_5683:107-622(+)
MCEPRTPEEEGELALAQAVQAAHALLACTKQMADMTSGNASADPAGTATAGASSGGPIAAARAEIQSLQKEETIKEIGKSMQDKWEEYNRATQSLRGQLSAVHASRQQEEAAEAAATREDREHLQQQVASLRREAIAKNETLKGLIGHVRELLHDIDVLRCVDDEPAAQQG